MGLKVARKGWVPGPWDDEPDMIEWETRTGLRALAARWGPGGVWCGYVEVPPGHGLHGVHYQKIAFGDAWPVPVPAHRSINYSSNHPETSDGDGWWFGFSCGHTGDTTPRQMAEWTAAREAGRPREEWYNLEFGAVDEYVLVGTVIGWCERMARALSMP